MAKDKERPIKLLFTDFETTGKYYWQNSIHQMAFILEIDGVEKEKLEYKVKPHPAAIIDDEALAVSGVTRAQLNSFSYFEQMDVYRDLTKRLAQYVDKYDKQDKIYIVAYNGASFDMQFFRSFFKQCGDNYFGSWFWSVCIDPMILAGQYLITERAGMENFQQSTVAKKFGMNIDENRLHDAMYDVEVMREIYRYMYPI